MNREIAVLSERALGQFPVSIGTSLAFEGAAGIYPEREESPPPISKVRYQQIWFNLLTVFRNLFEACERERRLIIRGPAMMMAIVEEMALIEAAVNKISEGKISSVFYIADYSKLSREYPRALLRNPVTSKQLAMLKLEKETFKLIEDYNFEQTVHRLRGLHIEGNHPESLIVTHCLTDLFERYRFKRLDLLESHTGIIKPHTEWNTKLTSGKEYPNLPFCKLTLQVMGDKGHHFNSMPIKIRQTMLDIAERDNWTVLTTREKIRLSLRLVQDPDEKKLFEALV